MGALVAYYSLTGNTELVAKTLAEELKADLGKIEEVKERKGAFLYLFGGLAALANWRSRIKPLSFKLADYDPVFIGSPIWAGKPVPAINAFIRVSDFTGKKVVVFCTTSGNDSEKALKNLASKVERKHGKVIGSFSISTGGATKDIIYGNARRAARTYLRI